MKPSNLLGINVPESIEQDSVFFVVVSVEDIKEQVKVLNKVGAFSGQLSQGDLKLVLDRLFSTFCPEDGIKNSSIRNLILELVRNKTIVLV